MNFFEKRESNRAKYIIKSKNGNVYSCQSIDGITIIARSNKNYSIGSIVEISGNEIIKSNELKESIKIIDI